jgi:hypothetical protein
MRSFIRHPSTIPIDVHLEHAARGESECLKDVGQGGLSFHSNVFIEPGVTIRVRIPLVKPVFQAVGLVTWCQGDGGDFEVGVRFLEEDDMFRARMVEQICHIEHYKREVLEKEGRELSAEEAAKEWISKFAVKFPDPDEPR